MEKKISNKKIKKPHITNALEVKITKLKFTVLTKEQVEAGRPKDAYDYVL